MITKVYEQIKKYIKENRRFLIFAILLLLIVNVPIPVYINTPGGIIPIDKRIEVSGGSESKGSFNLSYVSELRGTIPTFLLSYVIPNWDIVKKDDVVQSNETVKDVEFQNKIFLAQSQTNATRVAYLRAHKDVSVVSSKLYVTYLMESVSSNLKVGDVVLEVDGREINSVSEYVSHIKSKNIGDIVYFKIERNGLVDSKYIKVMDMDGKSGTGIYLVEDCKLKTDPSIKFHFTESESGPSGGLLMTLAIYDSLIPSDITHGLKIGGTGTIEADGSVGSISGLKYKLKGLIKESIDVFFVPDGKNYQEAKQIVKENNYDLNLVPVKTFDDAVSYLETIGK